MTSPPMHVPDDSGLPLLPGPWPPLRRTLLQGAVTSVRLTAEIAGDAAREVLTAGLAVVRRDRPPRV